MEIVGVPDARYGEELCAWIILREQFEANSGQDEEDTDSVLTATDTNYTTVVTKVTEDNIRAFCKGQISHYKIPRYIRFVKEFPFTISGKVKKFEIRNTMIAELNLEEVAK